MSNIAIDVQHLTKIYRLGVQDAKPETLLQAITHTVSSPFRNFRRLKQLSGINEKNGGKDVFFALKDVSFQVNHGEVLGVIGRNGAGKSTLLKVLSRITDPTSGKALVYGRVASLLEVGTGFHPELTGRENVFLNGTILGMRKQEIGTKYDEIVEFSGVEQFMDTPVKRYSSGMRVRLAFAVAAFLEPEILLIDEVLAVGDTEFQKKCLGKMNDVAREGRTVLFVSHNMSAISGLCTKILYLENGQKKFLGSVEQGIAHYLNRGAAGHGMVDIENKIERVGPSQFSRLISVEMQNAEGETTSSFKTGDTLGVEIGFRLKENIPNLELGVAVVDSKGMTVCGTVSLWEGFTSNFTQGEHYVKCVMPEVNLFPGQYSLILWSKRESTGVDDEVDEAIVFEVVGYDITGFSPALDRYKQFISLYQRSKWSHVSDKVEVKNHVKQ
ncbi:MAG: ABC transporter ATP-binding protein [Bacteroidota bacterium]|nr:ABC transporter ATP-binding protein [Bacteroidota bacterium]